MFASFYNLLRGHLNFSRKRRADDSENECPAKQAKYIGPDGELISLNRMSKIEKENQQDDEIAVVEEIRHVDWIAPRKSIRRKANYERATASSTPIGPLAESQGWRPMVGRERPLGETSCSRQGENNEVQFLSTVLHTPIERTSRPFKKSTVSDKIFRSFKPPSTRFTQAMQKKSMSQSGNYKKFLEEKMTYKRLLDLHQPNLHSPFTLCNIKDRPSMRKKVIVIDLESELKSLRVNREREAVPSTISSRATEQAAAVMEERKPFKRAELMKPVNSLRDYIELHPIVQSDLVIQQILTDHATNSAEKRRLARIEETKLAVLSSHNEKTSHDALEERLREYMKITEPPVLEIEEEPAYFLPEFTEEQVAQINKALKPSPPREGLSEKFGITITRHDMVTLKGLNWLNDEVINFYMNLLMERGNTKDSLPKVYAFNTFFYQNMIKGNYSSLRRWTRKVDLFSHDMVFAPVHLGMHWCMSVIDFRSKQVRYYDSMGAPNNQCLEGLISYLKAESLDKKKQPFDSSGWEKINVEDIPQQMNGSDCGVFACMFAEHLARDAPLLFTQDNMPYFRRKMVLEILEGSLIT